MTVEPFFVPGGVYLRTPTGELIGRLDNPGAPFETLDDARDGLDWLEMAVQFQQAQHERDLVGMSHRVAAGDSSAGRLGT